MLQSLGTLLHPGDMFPEEIATFALANNRYRQAFLRHHSNLLEAKYWQERQANVAKGVFADVYPYPDKVAFLLSCKQQYRSITNKLIKTSKKGQMC